jgi:hypothetical protein
VKNYFKTGESLFFILAKTIWKLDGFFRVEFGTIEREKINETF